MKKQDSFLEYVKAEILPFNESDISHLEGRLLTIVDSSISDPVQRKAMKDLVTQAVWEKWFNIARTQSELGVAQKSVVTESTKSN
jgi:hypothetical protein